MTVTIHEGDNRVSLRRLIDEGVRVHSVVTDPPYGLTSVTKRFNNSPRNEATENQETPFGRTGRGFMGQMWDGSGIERDPEFWRLVWEIMLPGAYCVAFSSSRTGHWQACAMESAGFIMHPMLGWVFGQGFPKATKPKFDNADDATAWDGWAYGGQALKPALEPIYVGQKPFSEKNGALNLLKHGVGAINIDGCRVAGEPWKAHVATGLASEKFFTRGEAKKILKEPHGLGRHPANLLHDGSPEVVALFPQTTSGVKNGGQYERETGVHDGGQRKDGTSCFGDTGSAARFFNAFPPDADPIFYQPKATKADRAGSKHPTVKPIALMRWLCRLVTPPGGRVLDPFGGSGTTAEAARLEGFDCTLMEAEPDYVRDLYRRFPVEGGIFG